MNTKRFALILSVLIVPVVTLFSILPPVPAPTAHAQSQAEESKAGGEHQLEL